MCERSVWEEEATEEEEEKKEKAAGAELKTKTPHNDVGKKHRTHLQRSQPCDVLHENMLSASAPSDHPPRHLRSWSTDDVAPRDARSVH